MTHHKDGLNEEVLHAILAGCEGVTPGPWAVHPKVARVDAFDALDPDGGTPLCLMLWPTDLRTEEVTDQNARHIARLDPDTVRSLVTELLERRRTPANEGGEPVSRERVESRVNTLLNMEQVFSPDQRRATALLLTELYARLAASPSSPVAPEGVSAALRLLREIEVGYRTHAVGVLAARAIAALTPAAEQGETDGWIAWSGGPMPVHGDTPVEYRFRSLDPIDSVTLGKSPVKAIDLTWEWEANDAEWPGDIVAYRLAPSAKEV
jgi:hypothetical protein